ncbi:MULTISPECIES: hypothetical protein [Metabacillus]|uniref:hypothetical protein n=1 Tax=Metabacillus TaxID=2675233 RepID=UPI000A7D3BD2|nr:MULTISPECIES: hypothetical protein [Metabacillus]
MANTGDIIFQLFTFAMVFGILSLIFKSRNTTKKRIDKLEKEIIELKSDKLNETKR